MPYKTILLHCNDRLRIEPLLAATVTLAERFRAHVRSPRRSPIISTHAALGSSMVIDARREAARAVFDALPLLQGANGVKVLNADFRTEFSAR
jgi:hypothetical protein